MPRFTRTQKRVSALAVAVAVVAIGGGIAFAYWSATGTGTGSAATGTSTNFTVTSSAPTGGPLSPGGPAETVAFSVNNTGTGSQKLSSVVASVAGPAGATWNAVAGCSSADYTVGTPAITYGNIAGSGSLAGTVTVTMNNLATNQDGCKNAAVPLYFVAS
jgi:hypothetical protein